MNHECQCENFIHQPKLVVLTGGPGAGKTAVLELARKSFCKHISVLPEAASIIFSGGFIRKDTTIAKKAAQRAIFHVQRELENLMFEEKQSAVILCDRGTLDGLAYWPTNESEFWQEMRATREQELMRYAAVIHLHSPAVDSGYNHSNPVRIETALQAAEIDQRIIQTWNGHPKRTIVESQVDFMHKAMNAITLIKAELPECCKSHPIKGLGA